MSNSQEATTTIDKEKQTSNLTAKNQKKLQVSKLPKPPGQSANSSNNTCFPKTKIPLQGPPLDKKFTLKKRSKTNISIQSHCGDPQKTRPLSQNSPQKLISNPSTSTLGSYCHTLGTIPKYLKRNATAANESELIAKKKITDAQICVPKTKIPSKGESALSNRSAIGHPSQDKKFSLKTRSKTNISIQSHCADPQNNRPLSQNSPKKLISNPSTATLRSQRHTLGTVPKYLKRNATAAIESELIAKQKVLLAQKKNVTDAQNKLLAQYKELQDYHKKKSLKVSKGQDFGEFHLLAVIRDNAGEFLIKDENLGKFPKKFCITSPRTDKVIAALPLEDMSNKIVSVHSAGFKLCQEFVDSFDNIRSSCETQEAGDASDLEKRVVAILKTMETKILEKEKDQKVFIADFIKEIQQSVQSSSASEDSTAELKKQLEDYQSRLEKSENEFKEWKSKVQENESKNIEKDNELSEVSVELKNLENTLNSKLAELAHKEEIIVKLQDEINQLKQTDNKIEYTESLEELSQKVLDASQLYEKEKELRLKIQNEMTEKDALIKRIESKIQNQDTDNLQKEKEELQNVVRDANEKLQELQQENYEIKKTLEMAETRNQELEDQLQQLLKQFNSLNESNLDFIEKITHLEASLSEKETEISHLQQKLENAKITLVASNENLDEMNRLRELAMEKTEETESLREKLARAEMAVKQQEGNVVMLQRLLRIRCELINSLQEKEASNRCRLDDLYTEINKKTRLVNQKNLQMNHEISAKAEELQNLFSTLSAKQIDISKQERTIKMLEHNNDRMQRLRLKQDERLAKLESENSELRHILDIYHESTINQDKTALQKLFVNWKQLFKPKDSNFKTESYANNTP